MKINASDVAALIGENPYKTRKEAIEALAINNGYECPDDEEEQETISKLVSSAMDQITEVCKSVSEVDLEDKIEKYEKKVVQTAIEDEVRRSRGEVTFLAKQCLPPSVVESIKRNPTQSVETVIQTFKAEIKQSPLIAEACHSINKIRGTILETQSTDNLQTKLGKKVDERNSKYYIYHIPRLGFAARIVGKLDGTTKLADGDAITEIKTRRRKWATVPVYDIIQLRCYMKLTGIKKGILHEEFPDKTSRTTNIDWSDSEWNRIEKSLIQTLEEVNEKYN
jgi:hypothetical protein